MFLITGHGRSGTLYTTNILILSGYQVGHEFEEKDGIVSWLHLDRAERYSPVIHQVRNPVNVISSNMTVPEKSLYRTFELIPEPKQKDRLYLAMHTWYYYCKEADRKSSWRFRIENLDNVYPELFERLGLKAPDQLPKIPKDVHTAKARSDYRQLTWGDLFQRDEVLAEKIRLLAKEYGYDVPKDLKKN